MTVVSTPAIRVQFQAHPGQQVIDASDARFRTVVCGRRWGKTKYALNVLFREAMQRKGLYWWTAPTYKIGVKARWHEFCRVFKDFIRYKTETDLWMEMINGSRIYWLSLESYDNIRGEGVDGLIIDEAAQVDARAWDMVIRPALMDKRGWALIITTPKGRNWVYALYQRGLSDDPDYASFAFPSHTNPYLHPDELTAIEEQLTHTAVRQELYAEFLDDASAVIRNVDACVHHERIKVLADRRYVAGVDLARKQDFTVVSVWDVTSHIPYECDLIRLNTVSWEAIESEVVRVIRHWNACALVDSTGLGDPVLEQLQRAGVRASGYQFTRTSKRDLIDHMAILFDRQAVRILDHPVANAEMRAYEMILSPTGGVSYSAPDNQHDDCVIARALALWQVRESLPTVQVPIDGLTYDGWYDAFELSEKSIGGYGE